MKAGTNPMSGPMIGMNSVTPAMNASPTANSMPMNCRPINADQEDDQAEEQLGA